MLSVTERSATVFCRVCVAELSPNEKSWPTGSATVIDCDSAVVMSLEAWIRSVSVLVFSANEFRKLPVHWDGISRLLFPLIGTVASMLKTYCRTPVSDPGVGGLLSAHSRSCSRCAVRSTRQVFCSSADALS